MELIVSENLDVIEVLTMRRKKLKRRPKRPYEPPPGYLTREGAARRSGVSLPTWDRYRALKTGPAATVIGGRVLWRIVTIDAWLLAHEEAA